MSICVLGTETSSGQEDGSRTSVLHKAEGCGATTPSEAIRPRKETNLCPSELRRPLEESEYHRCSRYGTVFIWTNLGTARKNNEQKFFRKPVNCIDCPL